MNVPKAIRMLILVISFLMFIWQASVALSNLMDPPVVDSTEKLNIHDIDPQLITICPLDQFNLNKLNQFGYKSPEDFLMGNDVNKEFIGWGAHLNLTFVEMLEEIKNYDHINLYFYVFRNGKEVKVNYEIRFYPRYGYCFDLVNFTTNGEVKITLFNSEFFEAQVYITDKKLRTRNDVHVASHWGTKIVLEKHWQHVKLKANLFRNIFKLFIVSLV